LLILKLTVHTFNILTTLGTVILSISYKISHFVNSVDYMSHCCIKVVSWDCLNQSPGSQVKLILCPMRGMTLAFKLILTIEVIVCPSCIYRVSQEDRSIFWEVIVSAIISNNVSNINVLFSKRFPRWSYFTV
jgi:hypothetical protein